VRSVVQRVSRARVLVESEVVGEIGAGLLVLVGVERGDEESDADALAERIARARVFADEQGRMNLSVLDARGAALVVSQFTLCADLSRGRRPSFDSAEEPMRARALVVRFAAALERLGCRVEHGRFGAHMQVESCNDGPVTLLFERRPAPPERA